MFRTSRIARKCLIAASLATVSLAATAAGASANTVACTNAALCGKAPVEAIREFKVSDRGGLWFHAYGTNMLVEHPVAETWALLLNGSEIAGGTIKISAGKTELVYSHGIREELTEVVHSAPNTLTWVELDSSLVAAPAGSQITVGARYSNVCEGEGYLATISPSHSYAEQEMRLIEKVGDPSALACQPK